MGGRVRRRKKKLEKEAETMDFGSLPADVFERANRWEKIFRQMNLDKRVELLHMTFERAEKNLFWEELDHFFYVIETFHHLAEAKQVEEGIRLLETFKVKRPREYMENYPYYDIDLLHYYVPHGKEEIEEIIEHFEADPAKGIDQISVALDLFRLYGMADEVSRFSRMMYQRLKDSDEITESGLYELNEIAIFAAIRAYITSPDYGNEDGMSRFADDLKLLDFWDEWIEGKIERLEKSIKVLRGEIKVDWMREDFIISNDDCADNVHLFMTAFIHHLHTEHGLEWVTGALLTELLDAYFGRVMAEEAYEDEIYFGFSEEDLDEYLSSFFSPLSLRDARGMAVLKVIECFALFLHQRGICTDEEFGEVERVVAELNKPLKEAYEMHPWRYRFVERWCE